MGKKIIQQADGLYSLWSSVVDSFVCIDCTRDELIDELVEAERGSITLMVDYAIERIENNQQIGPGPRTIEEAEKIIREIHGPGDEYFRVRAQSNDI